jgi:hypothetical protein
MQTNQKILQTALVYGVVSGVALGISEIALVFALLLVPYPLALFVGRFAFVLLVLAYLYAGYNASRQTGQVFTGTLAGALTGVFGVATVVAFSYIASFLSMNVLFDPQSFMGLPGSLVVASPVLSPLVRLILTFAFYGAIGGTVGGLIGKRRSAYP